MAGVPQGQQPHERRHALLIEWRASPLVAGAKQRRDRGPVGFDAGHCVAWIWWHWHRCGENDGLPWSTVSYSRRAMMEVLVHGRSKPVEVVRASQLRGCGGCGRLRLREDGLMAYVVSAAKRHIHVSRWYVHDGRMPDIRAWHRPTGQRWFACGSVLCA